MSESNTNPTQSGQSDVEQKKTADKQTATTADKTADPKKLELTQDELNQRIADGIAAEAKKREAAEAQQKADEKAARDKERGEFKNLYEASETKNKSLEAENAALKLNNRRGEAVSMLRDIIAAEAKDYANCVKYMAPLLKIDGNTSDDDIRKQAQQILTDYVKDNPNGTGTLPQKPIKQGDRREDPEPASSASIRQHFTNRLSSM